MFEIVKNNNEVKIKRDGVKYVAKFSKFDKKFVFEREFINGFQFKTHDNKFIFEVCKTNGSKEYFVIDSKNSTVTKVLYADLIKEKNENPADFCYNYFR